MADTGAILSATGIPTSAHGRPEAWSSTGVLVNTPPASGTDRLLCEDGTLLLCEDGTYLLLE